MGNLLKKFSKNTHYELTNSGGARSNLIYDNIHQELEENKETITDINLRLNNIQHSHLKLINELNAEIMATKNELSNTSSNLNVNLVKIKNSTQNIENEIQQLKNRVVVIESNEQFHSVCE